MLKINIEILEYKDDMCMIKESFKSTFSPEEVKEVFKILSERCQELKAKMNFLKAVDTVIKGRQVK